MENNPFPYYIEDWVLWIGRKRDNHGNVIDFPYYKSWPIKLANYDVTFVNRSSTDIDNGIGFTERQIAMAVKIVTKYQRQIQQVLGRDVSYLNEGTPSRLETREVDRSFSVKLVDDYYELRFPYNPNMVDSMHKLSANSTGDYRWVKNDRVWRVSKTERNLALVRDFVNNHGIGKWSIDSVTRSHFKTVDRVRSDIYSCVPYLELVHNNQLAVFNRNPHLDRALFDFDFNDDPANAAFRADAYGLRIGPNLAEHVKTNHSGIAPAILMSQSDAFARSKSLDTHLRVEHLARFMSTVRADYWVFLNFQQSLWTRAIEQAVNIRTVGEKIIYSLTGSGSMRDFINQFDSLDSNEIVVFSNNSMLTNRVWPMLESKSILRLIYLHGDTGS